MRDTIIQIQNYTAASSKSYEVRPQCVREVLNIDKSS